MGYGLKYIIQFSSTGTQQDYRFEILQANYAGPFFSLDAAAVPIRHSCQIDDPKAAIKGTSCVLSYINNGSNPLLSFYAQSDTDYKGILTTGTKTLFEGFMVQDDCTEIFIDTAHEVSLSFNDGVGLLKDITLDLAYKPGLNPAQTTTEEIYNYRSLMDIIKHCLYSTGLQLDTQLFENIFEADQLNQQIFTVETSVDMQTFLGSDNVWESCYTVLDKILGWYGLTLMQANGVWNIIRWNELRYYNGQIPGYLFDPVMVLQGSIILNDRNTFGASFTGATPTGQLNNPETGMLNRLVRPYKFVKKTFNYKRPINFTNADFLLLGTLLRQYTVGVGINLQTYKEYVAPYWDIASPGSVTEYFIRVIYNYLNIEVERYIVLRGPSNFDQRAVISQPIEVAANDFVSLSFTYRVLFSRSAVFTLRLNNTAPVAFTRFAKGDNGANNGQWSGASGWTDAGTSANEWRDIDINPKSNLPLDGALRFLLGLQTVAPGNQETHYKNIRLTYDIKVADLINITGHVHKDEDIDPLHVIKNNEDEEIYVDDSPKNSILGTTFNMGQDIGLLHKRTLVWYRGSNPTERLKVGNINVFEEEFWRRKSRTILEGTISGSNISPTTILTNDQLTGLNFIFGKWEFDYRNERATGTLWEMYQDGEVDADFPDNLYTFTYKT